MKKVIETPKALVRSNGKGCPSSVDQVVCRGSDECIPARGLGGAQRN